MAGDVADWAIFDTVLLATGDKERAHKAYEDRAMYRVKNNQKFESKPPE